MQRIMILLSGLLWFGCNSPEKKAATVIDEPALLQQGDSVAGLVQSVLLSNVMQATQQSGVAGAVGFCNEKAGYLTDSAGSNYTVQRLSDQNRNPANALTTDADKAAWSKMETLLHDSTERKKHFVEVQGGNIYYYKAINIAMPACLNCHGNVEKDIHPETLLAIQERYPADKATGYAMGAFRGIWKIKMNDIHENLP